VNSLDPGMIETEGLRASGIYKGRLPRAARMAVVQTAMLGKLPYTVCSLHGSAGAFRLPVRRDETKGQTIECRRRTEEFGSYSPLPDFCRHNGFNPIRTHLIGTVRANFGADSLGRAVER